MKHKILAVALLLLGPVAPAFGGAVYVPLAADQTIEDVRYRTQIWATNTDDELRRFVSYYIPSESDGTERPEEWGDRIAVGPGETMLLGSVTPGGGAGMLEISGAPHVVISTRMVATFDGVTSLGASMPVISSLNQFPAESTAHLQGWIRSGSLRSDLGVVNLGHVPASCRISVFRSDGSQIQGSAVILVPPLGHRQFDDALDILGETAIAAARSETSCDQPFFAYLRTYDRTTGELSFTQPSALLDTSTLNPPGEEPQSPGCSPDADFCFEQAGVFFTPRQAQQVKYIDFQPPPGSYSRLRAKMSFRHGGWNPQRIHGAHNIFWLVRDRRHFNLYGYMNVYGPPASEILWRHGLAQSAANKARIVAPAVFVPGRLYHIDYNFNAAQRDIDLVITNDQGQVIVNLSDRSNVGSVQVNPGEPYSLGLSFFENENPLEVPTYGWNYLNFVVELYD